MIEVIGFDADPTRSKKKRFAARAITTEEADALFKLPHRWPYLGRHRCLWIADRPMRSNEALWWCQVMKIGGQQWWIYYVSWYWASLQQGRRWR